MERLLDKRTKSSASTKSTWGLGVPSAVIATSVLATAASCSGNFAIGIYLCLRSSLRLSAPTPRRGSDACRGCRRGRRARRRRRRHAAKSYTAYMYMYCSRSVPWPAQYNATHLTPRQSKMGATIVVVLKLCGGRGVYERLELTEFHDPHPRHRLPSTAVSAEKRSMSKEAKIAKTSTLRQLTCTRC